MGQRTTIKDVAREAGVSYSTVSRALNDSSLIPEKTKKHVREVALRMGFVFNESARSLITRRSHMVAAVLPDHYESASVNIYHSRLVNLMRTELEKHGFDLILVNQRSSYDGTDSVRRLISQKKVDGILLLCEIPESETTASLRESGMPCVFVHYPPTDGIAGFDCVYSDNRLGGQRAAEYLLSRGCRDFLLVSSAAKHEEFSLREEGFLAVLAKAGCRADILSGEPDFHSARALASQNLSLFRKGNAVFAINDQMILGILSALAEKGRAFPRDNALMGYDDSEFCEYANPPVSTVHQGREEIAALSCRVLLSRMEKPRGEDEPPVVRGIAPRVVQRSTT